MKIFTRNFCMAFLLCIAPIFCFSRSVEVNLAVNKGPISHAASGFLFGFSAIAPSNDYFEALNPKLLRYCAAIDGPNNGYIWDWNFAQQGNTGLFSEPMMNRLEAMGVRQHIILGSSYLERINYDFSQVAVNGWPGDLTAQGEIENAKLLAQIDRQVNYVLQKEYSNIEWDLWNEPDFNQFWPKSIEQFYRVWKMMYERVRTLDPRAVIVGPSYFSFNYDRLTQFLIYAKKNNCLPDRLTWHELGDDAHRQIIAHVGQMRHFMTAELGLEKPLPIDLNEIIGHTYSYSPGAHIWYFSAIEEAKVGGACHAVWNEIDGEYGTSGQNAGNMCHLLTQDEPKHQPRSVFHAYRSYLDMHGKRLQLTPCDDVNGVATYDETTKSCHILLGNCVKSNRDATLRLVNVEPKGEIRVTASYIEPQGRAHVASETTQPIEFSLKDNLIEIPFVLQGDEAVKIIIEGIEVAEVGTITTPVLQEVRFLGGHYALELIYDQPMEAPTTYDDFEILAQFDGETQRFRVVSAYIHPDNPNSVILSLQRRVMNWYTWAKAKMVDKANFSYYGNVLKNTLGVIAPNVIMREIPLVDIVGPDPTAHYGKDRPDLYVLPVPINTDFEKKMWANSYSNEGISQVLHVNNQHPQASDDNNGMEDMPLKTIKEAISRLSPGTHLKIYNGVYRETITLNVKGSEDAPIVIEGIGDSVIISGAVDWNNGWVYNDGGISTHAFPRSYPQGSFEGVTGLGNRRENLFVDELKYRQVSTLSELKERCYFVGTDRKVHVKFPSGFVLTDHNIEMTSLDAVLSAREMSYLVLRNLHFTRGKDINYLDGNNLLIDHCSFTWQNFHGLTLKGNHFLIKGCQFNNNGASGLDLTHTGVLNGNNSFVNHNIVLEDCQVLNNNWRLGGYGGQMGEYLGGIKACTILNGVFRNIRIEGNQAPGLWLDIHHSNVTIENSFFHNNPIGFWAEICHGAVLLKHNTFVANKSGVDISHSGGICVDHNVMVNNTKYQYGTGWHGGDGDTRDCCFKSIYTSIASNLVGGEVSHNMVQPYTSYLATATHRDNAYFSTSSTGFGGRDFSSWQEAMQTALNAEGGSTVQSIDVTHSDMGSILPNTSLNLPADWCVVDLIGSKRDSYTISCSEKSAKIYYRVDGFIPDTTDLLYAGETITLPSGGQLLAKAIPSGTSNILSPLALSTPNEFTSSQSHTEKKTGMTLVCYPNPVKGILTIYSEYSHIDEICINDITGKVLYKQKNSDMSSVSVDLSNWRTGVYLLLVNINNETHRQLIIKK